MIKNNKYKILTPTTLVIFGATGDLVRRKLTAALFNLYCKGFMPDIFQIIGFSRRDYTDEQFRNFLVKEAIKDIDIKYLKEDLTGFLNKIVYQKGFFGDINAYKNIRQKLDENGNRLNMCANKLYYLAVPPNFYLESGKALKEKRIEIVVYFREANKLICPDSYKNHYYQNILNIRIYPEEGIFIRFWIKKPRLLQELESRDFVFNYNRGMRIKTGEYEKILLDCFSGDQTLFTSTEEIKHTWRFITPVLDNWDENELYKYKKGSAGPAV